MHRWFELNHFGRSGTDDGIDIQGIELLGNKKKRLWYFQCKRYKSMTKSDLEKIVDTIISKSNVIPDIIVAVVACNITKKNVENFKKYAIKNSIPEAQIWTSSIIETKLYYEYHDLLFAYFGVNLTQEKQNTIATVRRNIKMKQRMKKDFLKTKLNPDDTWDRIRNPFKRFKSSEILIRSIDDKLYPHKNETDVFGNFSWYKVEPYDFYHNGLKVIIASRKIIIDEDGNWDVLIDESELSDLNFESEVAFEIGCISYENIIEYDIEGDEFYFYPHLFCDFRNGNNPYEQIDYAVQRDGNGYHILEKAHRKKLL